MRRLLIIFYAIFFCAAILFSNFAVLMLNVKIGYSAEVHYTDGTTKSFYDESTRGIPYASDGEELFKIHGDGECVIWANNSIHYGYYCEPINITESGKTVESITTTHDPTSPFVKDYVLLVSVVFSAIFWGALIYVTSLLVRKRKTPPSFY